MGRIQELLAAHLDTLDVGDSDLAPYSDPARWRALVRVRDSLRAAWPEGGGLLAHYERRAAASDPDSLERAYRAGVDDAVRDLRRGRFRLKVLGLWPTVSWEDGGPAWCTLSVYRSVLQREYRVDVDRVAGDVLDGQWPVAYADGYNRVAAPVISAYWDVADVWTRARERFDLYVKREGRWRESEWSAGC